MGDLKEQYERLIERLYHEDNVFAQRTSNFIATHAFLAAALAFSLSGTRGGCLKDFLIPCLVTFFGLLLSLFYIPLGLRSYVAIRFWRIWLHGVESKLEFKLDSALGEFYKDGFTETSIGRIDSKSDSRGRKRKPMMKVFPWVFVKSTNLWLGVWLPALIAFFWAMALMALVAMAPVPYPRIRLYVVVAHLVLMAVLGYFSSLRPAIPTLSTREDKEE